MVKTQYKNPPIEEAICEFTFALPPSAQQFDLTVPGRLKVHPLMKEYSGDARTIQPVSLGSPPIGTLRVQLPSEDGKKLLTVGLNTLSISVIRPYDGWNNFRPRIERALDAYSEAILQLPVTRIGVKYINRIIVSEAGVDPNTVLTAPPVDDRISNARLINFAQTTEFATADGLKLLITQATLRPNAPNTTEYLLDIDAISDQHTLASRSEVIAMVEKLHDIEGETFESLITEKARVLFNAG